MVHDLIRLFPSDATEFESNGIGVLSDATSCTVHEVANGEFELEMTYPVDGLYYNDLKQRSLILCKPNPFNNPQAFRIYRISTPMNGLVTYYAQHISYDLSGYIVEPFVSDTAIEAMQFIKSECIDDCPFTFSTNVQKTVVMNIQNPTSIRSVLGGDENTVIDTYGGEYEFDNFKVVLHSKRGLDRDFTIRYGKNLTDFTQEEEATNIYTEVYPYWRGQTEDGDAMVVVLPERTVKVDGEFNFTNVLTLDTTSDFDEEPSIEDLREITEAYIKTNQIGKPVKEFEISFVQLSQTEEYKDYALLEQVNIFDTVKVDYSEIGVTATATVTETKYDAILGHYESIQLGEVHASIVDSVLNVTNIVQKTEEKVTSHMDKAVSNATKWITNGHGYMVAVRDEAGNWIEICSLDTPDINTAVNVWRWNNGGFGFSHNGYNGPYTTAITQDGHIVADFIDVGNLIATIITTGILKDKSGNVFYLDLDEGILRMNATELSISGTSFQDSLDNVSSSANSYADGLVSSASTAASDYADRIGETMLESANKYADGIGSKTLTDANNYTDTGLTNAQNTAQQYADGLFAAAENAAKEYTDSVFGDAATETDQKIKDSLTAALTQELVFNYLTDGGKMKGLFMRSGQLYVSGTYVYSGVITVGGNNNESGVLEVRDETGKLLMTLDRRGITLDPSVQISWNNISDKPNIPKDPMSAADILKLVTDNRGTIIDDDYIATLNVIADGLAAGTIITVGGLRNQNGQLVVYNASGKAIVTLDYNGITLDPSVKIKFDNISGVPSFAQTSDIPTSLSDLDQDIDYAMSVDIPKDLSDLNNDVGYVTKNDIPSGLTEEEIVYYFNKNKDTVITDDWLGTKHIIADGVYAGTVQGSSITGSTITGCTIKSAETGARIEMKSSLMDIYYSSGKLAGEFGPIGGQFSPAVNDPNDEGVTYIYMEGFGLHGVDGYIDMFVGDKYIMEIVGASNNVVRFWSNVTIMGAFLSKRTKSRVAQTDNYDERLLYGYETPSPMFGDIGEGFTDENGSCIVDLNDIFSETVRADLEYQVFLQKEGPGDIWVSEKTPQYFTVQGTPNLKFAWELKAKQKGYEMEHLEKYDGTDNDDTDYEQLYSEELEQLLQEREVY